VFNMEAAKVIDHAVLYLTISGGFSLAPYILTLDDGICRVVSNRERKRKRGGHLEDDGQGYEGGGWGMTPGSLCSTLVFLLHLGLVMVKLMYPWMYWAQDEGLINKG